MSFVVTEPFFARVQRCIIRLYQIKYDEVLFFLVAIFFIKLQNNSRQNVRQNHRVWVPVEGTFEIILGLT
jgi:hypothetical protein